MAETTTTAQKLSAEVIGTFVLVFFGCGAAVISGGNYVATGFAFGFTVLVMIYAFGRISGGHFNPAVSVGAALGGRMAWSQVLIYVAAQLAGALLAGFTLFVLLHGFPGYTSTGHMGQNSYGDAVGASGFAWWAAFLLELLMTTVFVWVILAVTDARNEHPALAPLAIGLALTMIHFASIGATGTSVNPARSIGVGVFAGTDAVIQLWLFILAPLIGGAVAGASYTALFGMGSEPVPGSGFTFSRRPPPCRATAPPTSTSRSGTRRTPPCRRRPRSRRSRPSRRTRLSRQSRRGPGAPSRSSRTAGSGTPEPAVDPGPAAAAADRRRPRVAERCSLRPSGCWGVAVFLAATRGTPVGVEVASRAAGRRSLGNHRECLEHVIDSLSSPVDNRRSAPPDCRWPLVELGHGAAHRYADHPRRGARCCQHAGG
ncbi:aquaporin [Nocardioides ungokensis]|uniref:aquaporin n=1 Tax=Nocardioides ungokensis TaxID=1643322 RepID=UPI0015E050D3|nr:aquaporin [Nocardioides ungokensis]